MVLAIVVVDAPEGDGVGSSSDIVVQRATRVTTDGSASGEGLSPPQFAATVHVIHPRDGGQEVPTATVDGPGRRLFGAQSVILPRHGGPFRLRQITLSDLGLDSGRSFVSWKGYVAVLTPAEARGARLRATLGWQVAGDDGVAVAGGATVRLRTMFRISTRAGACAGTEATPPAAGVRARLRLEGAPAWLVRREGDRQWQWLRVSAGLEQTAAVRTGPRSPVLFRGSHRCVDAQPELRVSPDPDSLAPPSDSRLPLDPPTGF